MSVIQTQPLTVTEAQRRQLQEDGYFITPILFDEATLEAVRGEFTRLWNQHVEQARGTGDPKTLELARFRPFMSQLDHQSEICRAFCHHPVFRELARQLIGPDVDLSWNQAILKPPMPPGGVSNEFGWHQDQWYALKGPYADDSNLDILRAPDNGITTWAAISRTTVDNGTLWVLPGRHKEGLLPHDWNQASRDWRGRFDTSWKVPAVLRAGQVLVFRKYLPHASGPNVSNETRMAYQIGYTVPGLKRGPSKDVSPLLRDGRAG